MLNVNCLKRNGLYRHTFSQLNRTDFCTQVFALSRTFGIWIARRQEGSAKKTTWQNVPVRCVTCAVNCWDINLKFLPHEVDWSNFHVHTMKIDWENTSATSDTVLVVGTLRFLPYVESDPTGVSIARRVWIGLGAKNVVSWTLHSFFYKQLKICWVLRVAYSRLVLSTQSRLAVA